MLVVSDILINMARSPLGLECEPTFTLTVTSGQGGCEPSRVHILVAHDQAFAPGSICWDFRGRMENLSSIVYRGDSLLSHHRYFVKARVWDTLGRQSAFSDKYFFETSFMGDSRWNASFIHADCPKEKDGVTPCFSLLRTFCSPKEVTHAKLYISAKGVYEAFLNGRRVSGDVLTPGWTSYSHRLAYQSYDVTDLVETGGNTLSVLLGDGWYKGFLSSRWHRNYYGDRRELICELHLHYEDGTKQVIESDGAFRWKLSNILMSEIYSGETCDGVFDCTPDNNDPGLHPVRVGGKAPQGYLHPSVAAPARYMETIPAVGMLTTPRGETVIDFGRVISGVVEFTVSGNRGNRVVLQCGDTLDKNGNFYNDNLELFSLKGQERPILQRIEYRCGGKADETYRPHFTYQCFRYVHVIEYPGRPRLEDFRAVIITSYHERTGRFSCGHREINTLFDNIINTQRATFVDLPIAGPQRAERLGWTGDGQLITMTACRNMYDAYRFFCKWLDDLVVDQRDDGQVGTMIPYVSFDDISSETDNYSASAAWGDAAVIVPYELYRFFGDRTLLERYCGAAKKYVEFMRRSGDEETLFTQGFSFGDWFALDNGEDAYPGKTDKTMIACFYYYRSTMLLSQMLLELGEKDEAAAYRELADRIRRTVGARFFSEDGKLAGATQTGCAMALHFGLAPKSAAVAEQLVDLIHKSGDHLQTGFIGTSILLQVLCDIGRQRLAYDLLLNRDYPSWIYPITKGATTIWEHWNGVKPDGSFWNPNMNSFCHLTFGSVGEWLYGWVLGLRQAEGAYGYRRFLFHPVVDRRLGFAEGEFRCVYGEITASWRFDEEVLELSLKIPVGTAATAVLPRVRNPMAVVEALARQGYRNVSAKSGEVEVFCESGRHAFRYQASR